jgi:hypothetical protein
MVAKCKYLTSQLVSQNASAVEVYATFILLVFSVTVCDKMGNVSDSTDTRKGL